MKVQCLITEHFEACLEGIFEELRHFLSAFSISVYVLRKY